MNWSYIAGFFDADGSITLSIIHKGQERSMCIMYSNNERSILEEIQAFILKEVNIVGCIIKKPKYKEIHGTQYELRYVYFPKCLLLMKKMKSQHPKKVMRYNISKELFKHTPRNGKYTQLQLEKREQLIKEFFST